MDIRALQEMIAAAQKKVDEDINVAEKNVEEMEAEFQQFMSDCAKSTALGTFANSRLSSPVKGDESPEKSATVIGKSPILSADRAKKPSEVDQIVEEIEDDYEQFKLKRDKLDASIKASLAEIKHEKDASRASKDHGAMYSRSSSPVNEGSKSPDSPDASAVKRNSFSKKS